jgi:hypothetical protein
MEAICNCLPLQGSRVDQLMGINNGNDPVPGPSSSIKKTFRFEEYMISMLQKRSIHQQHQGKGILLLIARICRYFIIFVFREVAAFKWFFWLKTYFQFPEFERKKSGLPIIPMNFLQ